MSCIPRGLKQLALLALGAEAALRDLEQRVTVGECADGDSYTSSAAYFPVGVQVGELPSTAVTQVESTVTSAGLIDVKYGNNFKVLTERLAKEQYVLTQCGTPKPSDDAIEAVAALGDGYQRKHFTIPLQSVIADTTIAMAFLRRLGVQDRVTHVDSYATGPCWQKALTCGAQLENGNATVLAAQKDSAEAVFTDCGSDCSNVRGRANAVHFSATKDNGNLHSAEYIKFMAAFFNLEALANQMFEAGIATYALGLQQVSSNKPVVAWISYSSWSKAFVLSQASYKLQMTSAAGAANVDGVVVSASVGDNMTSSDAVKGNPAAGTTYTLPAANVAEAAKTFTDALMDVDVVIDETYAYDVASYTFESFLSTFHLQASSSHKFIQNKMVLRYDGTISESKGWDWFESRVASPDWAVEGLVRVLNKDASKRRKYFRNIAEGEMPDVITAAMCSSELPSCNASSAPKELPLLLESVGGAAAAAAVGILSLAASIVAMA